MRTPSPLLAAGAAAALSVPPASQVPGLAYSYHWAPMADTVSTAFSGPALFGFGFGFTHAGPGDAIRRCYGIDTTQGGRNESTGRLEVTNYRIHQGWASANAFPGVDVGLVSIQAGTSSMLDSDVCFSPFSKMAGDAGTHAVVASAVVGLVAGTSAIPFPTVWDIGFEWVGTSSSFTGVSGRATHGGPGPFGSFANPLLVNVIYEIQGPLTGGPSNLQYYLASTTEVTGGGGAVPGTPAVFGTGGVTNGNPSWGSAVFGVDAAASGAISHSRILTSDLSGGALALAVPSAPGVPAGRVELTGFLGFQSPFLWASNDGSIGAGGADPVVSIAPTSVIDLHFQDHLAGAQTNSAIGGVGGPTPVYVPGIVFNAPVFLWSATPAAGMRQLPLSWDDAGGIVPASPGSIPLGPQATVREGAQTVPANLDPTMILFLHYVRLTFGTPFTDSQSSLFVSSYFEGGFSSIVSGVSKLGGGAAAIANPAPTLAGTKLGVAALGVQHDSIAGTLGITEIGSSLELNLQ